MIEEWKVVGGSKNWKLKRRIQDEKVKEAEGMIRPRSTGLWKNVTADR